MYEDDFAQKYLGSSPQPSFSQLSSPQRPTVSWRNSDATQTSLLSPSSSSSSLIENCFYIGIDFGTTYSGVAWAWSGDPNNINIIQNWPTSFPRARDNAKAPTKLVYMGSEAAAWGYEVTGVDAIEWFKLLLLNDQDIPQEYHNSNYIQQAKSKLRYLRKDPEEVISDYLRNLWKHTINTIKRERGESAVDGLLFRVVITVPAIWPPYAVEKMKRAAQKAGILDYRARGRTTLDTVPEPEAAALSTLTEYRQIISKDDVIIVCDCGGGTVDIITYKIVSVNPLKFGECVKGKGKLCGAIFVDEAFETLVRGRLGSKWEKLTPQGKSKIMEQEWEYGIKRNFSGNNPTRSTYTVDLPPEAVGSKFFGKQLNDKNRGISNGRIILDNGNIKGVFHRSINHISSLVWEQIQMVERKGERKPKFIILVGGYGACNFVYETLQIENKVKGIQVIQPSSQGPWAAICKGAVIRARENAIGLGSPQSMVVSRISRYHYGAAANYEWNDNIHDPADRFFCEIENKYMARDQMRWYLHMNTDIRNQQPVRLSYYRHYSTTETIMTMDIYQCESDPAPTRMTPTVRKLCSIHCNLRVDFNTLTRHTSRITGRQYHVLHYDVEMNVVGGSSVEFSVLVGGVRQGKQNVQVDFR